MGTAARVLVTEDDDAVRGVILRVLSHQGYDVLEASQMSEALDRWHEATASGPIDLLITDHMMPGGTGHDLAHALWALQPSLPVLFMSGYEDGVVATDPSEQVVHLSKPFNTTQLLGHVEQLLRYVRAQHGRGAP